MIRADAQPVVLTRAERDAMREAAGVDNRDPHGNDGVAMVKAVERIIAARIRTALGGDCDGTCGCLSPVHLSGCDAEQQVVTSPGQAADS